MIKRIFLFLSVLLTFFSCSDDDSFTMDRSALLTFTMDTLYMDTVFSTIGSSTYSFWAYNNCGYGIRISRAYLEKGSQSGIRINVDGAYLNNQQGSYVDDIEVRNGDSIRIFVEITASINLQGTNLQSISSEQFVRQISDNLIFLLESGVKQKVHLQVCAWDAWLVKDMIIDHDSLIQSNRPLVIYGNIEVREGVTLTIRKSTLFFHDKAGIDVYGSLNTDSVVMRGDRLDHMFDYLPYDRVSGQWAGIILRSSSKYNRLIDTDIHGSWVGIRCDSSVVAPDQQRLYMERTIVHNSKGNGVEIHSAYVSMVDCQITNSLGDCVFLDGGAINIQGCTLAQFYPFSADRGVAIRFVNGNDVCAHPLLELNCTNTVITGYANDELMGTQVDEDADFNYYFENCLLRTPLVEDSVHFKKIIWEKPSDEISGKKHFVKIDESNFIYDFHLDEASPAIGLGCYR